MIKYYLLFLLAFLLALKINAQPKQVDSLFILVNKNAFDTSSISLLNKLIKETYMATGNYDSAILYYDKLIKLTEKSGQKLFLGRMLSNKAIAYWYKANYVDALRSLFMALKIAEEQNDSALLGKVYNNISLVYDETGDSEKSIEYGMKSLKLHELLKDTSLIATCHVNLATKYSSKKMYDVALVFYKKAASGFEKTDFIQGKLTCYVNLATLYSDMYLYFNDSICKMFQKFSTSSCEQIKNSFLDSSAHYAHIALTQAELMNDKQSIAMITYNMGFAMQLKSKYREAITLLKNALALADAIGEKKIIANACNKLSQVYASLQLNDSALDYAVRYKLESDSILNQEKNDQIVEMETKYETEKKEQQIIVLNKDKEIKQKEIGRQKMMRNAFIGGFAMMFLFAGVFLVQRNKITKEKKRSDELLLNILPAETAQELKDKGSAEAKSYDLVTVLFTDFKNFTQASERMTAKELVNEINLCYSEFDKIISKYGIEKIKTIGDSYMCAGGLPVQNRTNPEDIVKAAIEIRDFMINHNDVVHANMRWGIRIGIHTGPVVAGIVGIKKFAYDIWGDTVNIASRMESSGEEGKINISGVTYELVKDKFHCIHRGEIEAKNKGMIEMYFVETLT